MGVSKENRWFKCPSCHRRFHIRRFIGSKWCGYMRPAFCPECGYETAGSQCLAGFSSVQEVYDELAPGLTGGAPGQGA